MTMNDVICKAKQFCKEYQITDYPVKIVNLCEQMRIQVFEQYLPKDVSGFIVIQEENFKDYGCNRVIVVNLSDSASRRRFTIAHELGHFILHYDSQEPLFAHRDAGQNGGIEQEANVFASNVLMPEDLVKKAKDNIDNEFWEDIPDSVIISYIADKFAVSCPAAEVRLRQLRMI